MAAKKTSIRKVGSIVNQLMSRRGYAQVGAAEELQRIVRLAVGELLADSVEVGQVKAGVVHLFATDSVSLQELNFQKRQILQKIQADMPAANVTDLRFKIQVSR